MCIERTIPRKQSRCEEQLWNTRVNKQDHRIHRYCRPERRASPPLLPSSSLRVPYQSLFQAGPSKTPFSLLSKQKLTWIAVHLSRRRIATRHVYISEHSAQVTRRCSGRCVFSLWRAGVIAWRKSKLQPAAGAPLLHARSEDVSVCIVIEWYNKGWSPWETENRATWRTVSNIVQSLIYRVIHGFFDRELSSSTISGYSRNSMQQCILCGMDGSCISAIDGIRGLKIYDHFVNMF